MVNIGRFFLFFAILFFLPFFLVLNQPNMTRKNLEADAHPVKEQDCKGFYTKRQEGEKACKEGITPLTHMSCFLWIRTYTFLLVEPPMALQSQERPRYPQPLPIQGQAPA